jgi:ABC-type sulfate/molybdate transport systems ATPase subunit
LQRQAKEMGTTIMIVTHDNRILDVADRIVTLVDGSIRSDALVKEAAIITQMLAKCRVFERVTPRTLTRIADELLIESAQVGIPIIRENDPGDRFFLIREGRVSVRRGDSDTEIVQLGAGDFFGEMALLTGQPRNATVWPLEETLLELPVSDVRIGNDGNRNSRSIFRSEVELSRMVNLPLTSLVPMMQLGAGRLQKANTPKCFLRVQEFF